MQAQTCSASIPTDTVLVCHSDNLEFQVTLSGKGPFTFTYSVNGEATSPIVTLDSVYTVVMYPASQTNIIKLVAMQDATGCQGILSGRLTAKNISVHLSTQATPASCIGTPNGSATVNVQGNAYPPYTYYWSTGDTTKTITGSIGHYTVTVTNALGCIGEWGVRIPQREPLQIAAVVTNPTCNHNDGSIDITVSGGTEPYFAAWPFWNGGGLDLTNIGSGTYTVTVVDANECTGTYSTSISTFDVSIQQSYAECRTNLDVTSSGSTAPYTYVWSNGQTTEDLSDLSNGTYTVTVSDAAGCTVKKTVIVNLVNPYLSVGTIYPQCYQSLDVYIQGMSSVGATYVWSTGMTGQTLTNIPAGTYTVTVTAGNTCTSTASITTTQFLSSALLVLQTISTSPNCVGDANGSIDLTVSGAAPPFTYQWTNGDTTQDISHLAPGSYRVTVTDANGCTSSRTPSVAPPVPLNILPEIHHATCDSSSGYIPTVVSGGTPPYAFTWLNTLENEVVSTSESLADVPGGTYQLTVTDSLGCTFNSEDLVVQPAPFIVNAEVVSSLCDKATLSAAVYGASGDFIFSWKGPNGFISDYQEAIASLSGVYTVEVVDTNGCIRADSIQLEVMTGTPCGLISGNILRDEQQNCLVDPEDSGLGGWLVMAERDGEALYSVSNADGTYQIDVPAGTYTVKTVAPNALWEPCSQEVQVTVDIQEETVSGIDLTVKPVHLCPLLEISLGTDALQPCFEGNVYNVSCFNKGTTAASNAYALIAFDPLLTPIASDIPYIDIGEGKLRFDLGDMAPWTSVHFRLQVALSCDAAPDQAHCTEAHIYPDGDCIPVNPLWSGGSLRLSSRCASDLVRFTIINAGTGNMPVASTYSILKDANVLTKVPFQLASGDSTVVALSADGSTWRMEVDQAPFHPGHSSPALSVEGCGNVAPFSTGFVTQFANDEANPWVDIDCTTNSGSHGSNDKLGMPVGYGTEHYVRPATEIEYMIRFQNTGMDTAFRVRVVDSLASWLDVSTIRPGSSSHPYKFNLTGSGIAEFLFENIQLSDSNTNEAASHGFVKFSIYPKATAPLETLIENTAHIYFDFNDAVVTNTTRHRLGEDFVTVGLWQPERAEYKISASPNPFSETTVLEINGLTFSAPIHLLIIDIHGKIVHEETAPGPVLTLRKQELPNGMYLFRLDQQGAMIGSGKLIVQE